MSPERGAEAAAPLAPAAEPPPLTPPPLWRGSRRTGGPRVPHRGRRVRAAPVRAFFDDVAFVHDDEAIHRRDRRQAVRDGDHGLALHQVVELLLDRRLDFAVERARRFIEDQDRRVLQQHARDRDALALAAGKLHAPLADVRVITGPAAQILQRRDELVRRRHPRRRDRRIATGIGLAIEDVVEHGTVQQRGVLRHHSDVGAQTVLRDVRDVLPIDHDAATLEVVETQQQVDERRLARTRTADKPDLLARPRRSATGCR